VVLAAFLSAAALALAGTGIAALRGLRLWRQVKHTTRAFTSQLGAFEEKTARTERHLAEWERSSADLEPALARLRASRARLRVLQDAIELAQVRLRWLRVFVPR
jgi:exonuclease VII small subunit